MTPPRRQREQPATGTASIVDDWRDMLGDREDLQDIARGLRTTGLFPYREDDSRRLPAPTDPVGDGPTDLDVVDAWLHDLDVLGDVRSRAWRIAPC